MKNCQPLRLLIAICIVILASATALAQGNSLKGFVYEESTGEPMMFTNVYLKGTTFGGSTNENGYFNISRIPDGKYTLVITSVGYDTIAENVVGVRFRDDVRAAMEEAIEVYKSLGAQIVYFDLPSLKYALPVYYIIACAEASSNLERFDGVKYGYRTESYTDLHNMYKKTRSEGFGAEVKRRIMLGSFVLSSGYYDAYYVKALRVKALIKQAFDQAFEKYDVILGPVAPTTALPIGESLSDPIKMYLGDIYTVSVNLAGLPGISIPCGEDKDGLPVGLQLLGQTFAEKKIIRAAYTYEQNRE